MIINIIIVALSIGFVIFIHELGHFFVAKYFKVNIEKFSIGFGKEIFGFTKNNTRYSLSMIPLGGFVKMKGDNLFEQNEIQTGDFLSISYFKKILIIIAGPLINIIFAFLVITIIGITSGLYTPDINNLKIGNVLNNSAAAKAGIMNEDKIIQINGEKIINWNTILNLTKTLNQKNTTITIERNNKQKTFIIKPSLDKESQKFIIGIMPKIKQEKLNILNSAKFASQYTITVLNGFITMFTNLFNKKHNNNINFIGPIGVFSELTSAIKKSFSQFLFLLAIVNLNLGFLNLLPIPILDGGHIILHTIEHSTGLKINRNVLEVIYSIIFIGLLLLTIFATKNDITNMLQK